MENNIGVVLVGFGDMGRNYHLPLIENCANAQLLAVVRQDVESEELGVPVYRNLSDALLNHAPNLVIIATPHALHYEAVVQSLCANCHVLVEKPVALEYDEVEHVIKLSQLKNKYVVVGLQRRYEGLAQIYRELVVEDKIGKIEMLHGLFAHRFSEEEGLSWRSETRLAGEGILHDSAFHVIDLLIYFSGSKVNEIQYHGLRNDKKSPLHSFSCLMNTHGGSVLSVTGSYLSPINSVQEEVSIYGSKGSLFGRRFCKEWNTEPPMVFYKSVDGNEKAEYDMTKYPSGRKLPLEALLKAIGLNEGAENLYTIGYEVLETHRVISEIVDSNMM